MKPAIQIDSTPRPGLHLPFANETEVQKFVEKNAKSIFGLKVIASTTAGKRGLFKIDVLAVDAANTPFIFECKWNQVGSGAIRQLVGYRKALLDNWPLFEKRVSEMRRRQVAVKRRTPVLVAIGYGYKPAVLIEAKAQSVVCLTYAYHPAILTVDALKQPRSGKVSIQGAPSIGMPTSRHPTVSKKTYTFERLAPLPPTLQTAFWAMDDRLLELDTVTAVYLGKGFVRYRVPQGIFAEAKIGPKSIEWRYCEGEGWKNGEKLGSVEMLPSCDNDKIFNLLRQASARRRG